MVYNSFSYEVFGSVVLILDNLDHALLTEGGVNHRLSIRQCG